MYKQERVYISGSITGIDGYLKHFAAAEQELMGIGYTVVNPAAVLDRLPKNTEWECYMGIALAMLMQAEAIYLLPGWRSSKGACIEYAVACAAGKRVIYGDMEEMVDGQRLDR